MMSVIVLSENWEDDLAGVVSSHWTKNWVEKEEIVVEREEIVVEREEIVVEREKIVVERE
jgi:hypothetical protein